MKILPLLWGYKIFFNKIVEKQSTGVDKATKSEYSNSMNNYKIISFLEGKHPSKAFMPALGIKSNILHSWKAKGIIDLPAVGTGTPLFLSGKEIVYLRCLVILSNAGFSLKSMCVKGLKSSVNAFAQYCQEAFEERRETEEDYVVFRYVGRVGKGKNAYIDGEWDRFTKKDILDTAHISELSGQNALPFWGVLSLTQVTQTMAELVTAGY